MRAENLNQELMSGGGMGAYIAVGIPGWKILCLHKLQAHSPKSMIDSLLKI